MQEGKLRRWVSRHSETPSEVCAPGRFDKTINNLSKFPIIYTTVYVNMFGDNNHHSSTKDKVNGVSMAHLSRTLRASDSASSPTMRKEGAKMSSWIDPCFPRNIM